MGYYKPTVIVPRHLVIDTLRSYMKDNNLTKPEVAEKLGVCHSVLTRWLSGKHEFTIKTIDRFEQRLGIELLDLQDQHTPK